MCIVLKKLKGHIALGLSVRDPVRAFVRPSVTSLRRVLKFHRWTQHQKITDPYFFNLDYLHLWSYAPFKGS